MNKFTKKDAEIVKQIFDIELLDHLLVTELQWQFENAEAVTDIKALEIVIKYFGGNSE